MVEDEHQSRIAEALVSITGVLYFASWSLSFYPQVILNYRRKKTVGLSPDFVYVNPLGFLALTIWSWGAYYSPLAREQYRSRHDGHNPQVSRSDLAFSLHALIISTLTLLQVWYYGFKNRRRSRAKSTASMESRPLLDTDSFIPLDPVRPSKPVQLGIYIILISSFIVATMVWAGKTEWLDWLYFVSSIKLVISLIKYIPQIILNWRLRSVEGFSIGNVFLDLSGSVLSFAQLVISSVYIEHDSSGIIANPAKLGLALLSLIFDIIFIVQNYWLFRGNRIEREDGTDTNESRS